jgi:hypothetical protein
MIPLMPSRYEIPNRPPDYLKCHLSADQQGFRRPSRYNKALLDAVPIEGSVAWSIANLEALFLGDNPTTEIS